MEAVADISLSILEPSIKETGSQVWRKLRPWEALEKIKAMEGLAEWLCLMELWCRLESTYKEDLEVKIIKISHVLMGHRERCIGNKTTTYTLTTMVTKPTKPSFYPWKSETRNDTQDST